MIDEDLMVRQALGQVRAAENHPVVPAAARHEARREFQNHSIEGVLPDSVPRKVSEWETPQLLTTLHPYLPLIAMTARREQTNSNAHGVDVLLEKSLNLPGSASHPEETGIATSKTVRE